MLWLLLVQAMLCYGEEEIFPDDPRLAYIGRFATSPGFFLSSTPGNECPEGSSKVTEKGDCWAAMAWASDPSFEWQGTESEKNWPHGCYFCDDVDGCSDGTWFNSNSGGKAHEGARPYCKGGDAPADATRYYAWPGSQIEARFSGTRVSANLTGSHSGDRFLAVLDGEPREPFVVAKHKEGWKQYTLAEGLSPGDHTLALWKITEDLVQTQLQGACRFGGLSVDGQFLDPPAPRERRLEFIGDSDTAGYCADGHPSGGDGDTKVDDTYKTWAAQLARRLNADFVALAISGDGVEKSTGSVPDKLSRILPFQSASVGAGTAWDFSDYVPDAVVMLIGPNDNQNKKFNFKPDYMDMMNEIVSNYAHASTPPALISVIAGSGNGFDPAEHIREVTEEFNTGRGDGFVAYYTNISKKTWTEINAQNGASQYNGCDAHYNEKGHAKVADEILPQVEKIMGWGGLGLGPLEVPVAIRQHSNLAGTPGTQQAGLPDFSDGAAFIQKPLRREL